MDEVRAEDAVEKLESPSSGNDLMRAVRPGPWALDQGPQRLPQNEVIEGRLGKDDKERARELAEAYAREHDIFEE